MLTCTEFAEPTDTAEAVLTLPFDSRQKARLKAESDDGQAIGFMLPRGKILRGGDKLKAENGVIVEIKAANEAVSTVTVNDTLVFAKICYHLGNRHVPLEINRSENHLYCRYAQDHVLDDMVKGLMTDGQGQLIHEQAPFEPESGAYANANHAHGHANDHSHHHDH